MKKFSNPNFTLLATRKYCSDINMLTGNIIDELPGEYKSQFEVSVNRLASLNFDLNENQKSSLLRCKTKLLSKGENELSGYLSKVLTS